MQPLQATKPFTASIQLLNYSPLRVDINKGQNLKDLVAHLVRQHNIPPYLTPCLHSTLATAIANATAIPAQEPAGSDKDAARDRFVRQYQTHTLQYHNKPEEDIFPRAYHTLVHCPIEAMYNTLLSLEQDYALVIQDRYLACEKELADIEARQYREIESSPGSPNMTHLFARHVEDMEVFQATHASDILQTQQTQRREYRAFVIELYREYQQRLAALSDEKNLKPEDALIEAERALDGKDIVKVAAERMKESDVKRRRQSSSATSLGSGISSDQTSMSRSLSQAQQADKDKAGFQSMVKDVQAMGFPKDKAEMALMMRNSVEAAVELLLESPDKVDTAIRRRSSSAHSRSNSVNNDASAPSSRRQSFQKSLGSPLSKSVAANKGWSPISFLQQQKQVMENTNLSSVRKLGSWLGRAMENIGIDHDVNDFASSTLANGANAQQPVESFTISLGPAQIKSTHNLRLLVAEAGADIFNPTPYDPTREMAYKAQTSTKLYTNNLSAIIVLVELSELNRSRDQQGTAFGWRQYRTGKGSNKALFDRCQHSTEFHFPDIETQLTTIEQDFAARPGSLQEGSFFVTRHSNLPLTQVVFHLVIDSDAIATNELTKQSNLIKGLLSIMRLTTRYDISSLSIPLLLLPDKFLKEPEQFFSSAFLDQSQHFAWLQKRGEVTMKCVRGFLYEHSGSGKRGQSEGPDRTEMVVGGGLHNVEFLLPDRSHVYGQRPDIGQDVEYAFQQFRILLVSIFQTS
ncbi:hypothetical protein BJV82DRAFT_611127 [Fennellomyces sp. T-0311]|nr:hypothetical protein BJV82DRAFT_611127 [Fennellomyces sp. T-0311]